MQQKQLAQSRIPGSGENDCFIKGQTFSYYFCEVWEEKEPLLR